MNLENICNQVVYLSKNVGEFIASEAINIRNIHVEQKGLHDFVTHVDKASEKMIVEGLENIFPEAGFIAEEGTSTKQGENYKWVIDPLDGTTNYIHGLSPYAVSIALMKGNKVVLGVVYEVGMKECFYAWEGSPAYLNGTVISVSEKAKIEDSLIATGFPYHNYERIKPFLKSLEYFMRNSHGVRRLGSAATDLVYVACGRFEAFYEYSLNPWDVAAGSFIVQQAGGKVSDFKGGNDFLFGEEIVAGNDKVFNEFLKSVNQLMIKGE